MNKLLYLIVTCILFSIKINAQNTTPKLGLTLSGGGAKGLAHIGVLKVLEEEGIRPDFITGTSMGSIVGGLYAIGYSVEQLETATKGVAWKEYFTDDLARDLKPIEYKKTSERYQFSFPIENGKIQFPKGFIQGAKMSMLLSELTLAAHEIENFDDFDIPFRCVATDLVTGQAHVFDKGCLADAMRASAGIPTVFEPIEIDGKTLVDGMVVRNLPVEDAKNMGADFVIAVDVGSPLSSKEELNSIIGVLDQTTAFSMVKSTLDQQKMADLVIFPELKGISPLDFDDIETIIARGEAAARKMLPEIRAIKEKLPARKGMVARKPVANIPESFKINSLEVEVGKTVDIRTVERLLKIKTPQVLTKKELTNKMMGLYASGFFDHVDYQLHPELDGYKLLLCAWKSPDVYLKFGGYYDSDINAAILLNGTVRNMLMKGSQLSVDLRVSETPALLLDYILHTNSRPNVGFHLNGKWNFFPGEYYNNNELVNEFYMQHASGQAGVYSGISNHSSLWFGIGADMVIQKQRFNLSQLESVNLKQTYAFANFERDNYNRKYFPTKGFNIDINGKYIFAGNLETKIEGGSTAGVRDNYYVQAAFSKIFPIGKKVALQWYNKAGYANLKQGNYINLFYLGRNLSYEERAVAFIGFDYMEQLAQRYAFSGLNFQWEPAKGYFLSALFNVGYFELDEFEIVRTEELVTQSEQKEYMSGIGLRAGMLVRQFGPISLNTEYNFLTENFHVFLTIGYGF